MSASAPLDANAMRTLLKSMGVHDFEPRVLHQLLEYAQSYCADIFADSALYAEHAGRPGCLESEDVQLSVRLKAAASQLHSPLLIEQLAKVRNHKGLSTPMVANVQLPNPKLCLVEENWQLAPRSSTGSGRGDGAAGDNGSGQGRADGSSSSSGPGAPRSGLTSEGRVAFSLPPGGGASAASRGGAAAMDTS